MRLLLYLEFSNNFFNFLISLDFRLKCINSTHVNPFRKPLFKLFVVLFISESLDEILDLRVLECVLFEVPF